MTIPSKAAGVCVRCGGQTGPSFPGEQSCYTCGHVAYKRGMEADRRDEDYQFRHRVGPIPLRGRKHAQR